MNDKPLVSVIIPTYKRSNMLDRTINCVLAQTYENIEIIVVDDNNPNTVYRQETESIMSKYEKNKRIRYVKHEKNMNGAVARNTGLKNANGTYVCFLDDDDIIYEQKIERQVRFLEKNTIYDAVYCARKINNYEHKPRKEGNLTYELLSGTYLVITIMFLMKTSVAKEIGGWIESFSRNQEAAFLLKFFDSDHKIGYIDEVLCETDLSDRSNASNAEKFEKDMMYYLKYFKYIMDKKSIMFKIKVYSHRGLAIVLTYLKERKYKIAIKKILKYMFKFNFIFTFYFIKYGICKIFNIPQNGYYLIGDENEK